VVDAKLAALALDTLLGGAGVAMNGRRIAGVGVHQDQLADVVQERSADQAVAIGVADLAREQLGGRARRERVKAEAVGRPLPDRAALEVVESPHPFSQLLNRLRREDAHRIGDIVDPRAIATGQVICDAQHRDDECDIRFDGLNDISEWNPVAADEGEQPVARLGERWKAFKCVERGGEAPPVALTRSLVNGLSGGLNGGPSRNGLVC